MEELGDLPCYDPILQGKEPVHCIVAHCDEELGDSNQDCERQRLIVQPVGALVVETHYEESCSHICHDEQTDQRDEELIAVLAADTNHSDR